MKTIRKNQRIIAVALLLIMNPFGMTPSVYALTSGPSQPEVQSFQPATASNMVNLFTGDFSYNIPLFELPGPNGGYPFNLSYQSGVTMDQEASWVGLGFNLNPGAVTRQMRGLPDEFDGDLIRTKMSVKPSITIGAGAGASFELFGSDWLKGTIGLSVRQNNYRGFAYAIDGGLGFGQANSGAMTNNVSAGVGFSLDSQEGLSVSPSLDLGTKLGSVGLGMNYNSKSGLSNLSVNYDVILRERSFTKDTEGHIKQTGRLRSGSIGSNFSFAHPGYTPQITMPMSSFNFSGVFKFGGAFAGAFAAIQFSGYYNEQRLKNDKKLMPTAAYGYQHMEHAKDPSALMDVNREKDGMVSEAMPNLGIPSLSYDIYSISGQGVAAMARAQRNDYGIIRDPSATSESNSIASGVEVGIPLHVGFNVTLNHASSTSGGWTDENDLAPRQPFQTTQTDKAYEPYYFKTHGELTTEPLETAQSLGDDKAVRVQLSGHTATKNLEAKGWNGRAAPESASVNRERKPRSQTMQIITNQQLLSGSIAFLPYFYVSYFENEGLYAFPYDRGAWPKHHTAGIITTTPEGLRYIYALPAYNTEQEEVTFSAKKSGNVSRVTAGDNGKGDPVYDQPKSDKFLKRVGMPAYAYAHLLTSILGPDYVDVTGNGVTPDDLGYWVKFTYRRIASKDDPFQWRDPFSQAHYQEGWITDPKDDRGSFVYGEKEIWYLAQAETKSHIATFILDDRDDGKGVAQKLQDTDQTGKSVKRLKEIRLFSRFAGENAPIKVCKFDYNYALCPGIFNNPTGQGKLTLTRLSFEYGNSTRGRLNPYVFTYAGANPGYDFLRYDRWGNYKPYPAGNPYANHYFPYCSQDEQQKGQIDANAAAWSLTGIQLPSGGQVDIDYETDDYAYVQHKPAMQMMDFVDPYGDPTKPFTAQTFNLTSDPKIRFRLEKPITGTLSLQAQRDEVNRYLDATRDQLFFKLRVNLQEPDKDLFEYISAYADIDRTATMGLEAGPSGKYEYGFFYLKKERGYHPLALRAWQHVRTNQPQLPDGNVELGLLDDARARIDAITSLAESILKLKDAFRAFYKNANDKKWGKEIMASQAWVRLRSPDGFKYGGGLRVKQITLRDQWSGNEEGVYGQRYEYTVEENGRTISSGVAAYEPFIGGEENPLRYAKPFVESVPLATDNNLFFEYPINESYYPGPEVGYRKVTVMSLASASRAGRPLQHMTLSDGADLFPGGAGINFGSTGKTEHEFFTAKDFPVMTYETDKLNVADKEFIPIPLVGSIASTELTASQGYSVVTNDMHGRQKRVSQFRQAPDGSFEVNPMSYVEYKYNSKSVVYEKEMVQTLVNIFKDNGDGTVSEASQNDLSDASVSKVTLGQETDFFTDMREFKDNSVQGGVNGNVDIVPAVFVPIPIPTFWPNAGKTSKRLRTVVTNKVIFKAGILKSTTAYDGGSKLYTQNLCWDKLTGATVLQSVNNNFDAQVYSLTTPAYTQYQGMGGAYKTAGLAFSLREVRPAKSNQYEFVPGISSDNLFPGDEFILYSDNLKTPVAFAVYLGSESGKPLLWSAYTLNSVTYSAMVVRSGYRNQLSVSAGSITALDDPTKKGVRTTYTKKVTIPDTN